MFVAFKKKILGGVILFLSLGMSANAQTSPYTGVAVGDIDSGNDYYLYNVDFGTWLGDNDRNTVYGWTSHAEIGSRGRDIQITAIEGGYQLNPKMGHNHSINGYDLYMDTDAAVTTWTITSLNNGISNAVKIKSGSYGLSVNDAGDMDQNADSGDKHNNWQIVTAEERWNVAKSQATAWNAVNVSWCVLGGTFPVADDHRSNGTWQGTTNGNNGFGDQNCEGDATIHCNRVWEMWNITSKDVYQIVTVPNGIYKVSAKAAYVSTGGDDMSSDHYNEWAADPAGNTKGFVYANRQSTPMINAYAMTSDSKVDNKVTKDLGNGKWVSNGKNQFSARMFDGEFKTNDMWVVVTDNTLKVGVKVENGGGTSWILFDDFTVTYYGDELLKTIAYAKARGVDVSAQEDFLNNHFDANEVENQKNATIIALKQQMADKSPLPTIYTKISESVVGTDDNNYGAEVTDHADGFYAYNVGTGRWFCGGDEWGAHAAVGFPGIKITTPKNDYGSGHYNSVKTWLFNGNWNDGGLLGNNGYCDTGGNAWKFWQKDASKGIYTWSNNGNDHGVNESNGCGTKDLVGFSPSTYMRVDVHQEGADDPYNQWIFVTEAQRDEMAAAAMATASELNPVDLTYKIKMPGFNQRERKEGSNQSEDALDWTCNHANYCYDASNNSSRKLLMGRNDNHPDFVCDVYGYSWNDAFSWTQTVTGLTPGKYRVKVQGYNNGGSDANKACLVANGEKVALVERSSETVLPWTSKLPENTFDNPEYFQAGCYWNEVLCIVGSNGELTLGVESPSVTGGHVIIFDNFRLEYVGSVTNVPVSVSSYGIATFSSVFHLDFTNTGITPYRADRVNDEGNIVFKPIGSQVPANTGVLLKSEEAVTADVTVVDDAAAITEQNLMKPSVAATTLTGDTYYVLAMRSGDTAPLFYQAESGYVSGAGKAYLEVPASSSRLAISFDDTTTGIETMHNSECIMHNKVYDLQGRPMVNGTLRKGMYIVNGKKQVVK